MGLRCISQVTPYQEDIGLQRISGKNKTNHTVMTVQELFIFSEKLQGVHSTESECQWCLIQIDHTLVQQSTLLKLLFYSVM